jgi:hypothetical protein
MSESLSSDAPFGGRQIRIQQETIAATTTAAIISVILASLNSRGAVMCIGEAGANRL